MQPQSHYCCSMYEYVDSRYVYMRFNLFFRERGTDQCIIVIAIGTHRINSKQGGFLVPYLLGLCAVAHTRGEYIYILQNRAGSSPVACKPDPRKIQPRNP